MIIAILAFLGGWAYLIGGILSVFSGVLMLTSDFPTEIAQASDMSPQTIGVIFLVIAFLMIINGLIFIVFGIGTFIRSRRWARYLGIFGYLLNIVVFLVTVLTTTTQNSLLPYIFGTFVAIAFIIILAVSKSAFEKSPASGNQNYL